MPCSLHPLPALADNYIWTLVAGDEALVVDPGDAAVVERWLADHGLRLRTVLVTHHHADHVAGLLPLKDSHAPVIHGPDEGIAGVDRVLRGGETLSLGPFGEGQVLAVPGHTRGHIAYYLPSLDVLFCGDTLFSAGCGRLFEGTAAELHASLAALAALPDRTRVCCTHEYTLANLRFAAAVEPGNADREARERAVRRLRNAGQPSLPVTLGEERTYNPFLRCHEPAVVAAASRQAGETLAPGLPVLAALRRWKDRF